MQIDLHIALPEASAVTGSVVSVVRRSNGVDGTIDVIDRIDGFVDLDGTDELKKSV